MRMQSTPHAINAPVTPRYASCLIFAGLRPDRPRVTVDIRRTSRAQGGFLSIIALAVPLAAAAVALGGCGHGSAAATGAQAAAHATAAGAGEIAIYPRRAAVTLDQRLELTAFTGDPAGITWTVSPAGATVEPAVSHRGQAVTFIAPRRPGIYTITATGTADPPEAAVPAHSRS